MLLNLPQPFDAGVQGGYLAPGRRATMAEYAILLYAPVSDVEAEPAPEELEAHDRHAENVHRGGCHGRGVRAAARHDSDVDPS